MASARIPATGMDRQKASLDDVPLKNRVVTLFNWIDNGDSLGFRLEPGDKDSYMIDKKAVCKESLYLRRCYTSSEDRYPRTTARLMNKSPGDKIAWLFVLAWLSKCQRIPVGLDLAEKQPQISKKQWCEDHLRISFLEWTQVYCLAEALHMPRLEDHVIMAAEYKAVQQGFLPRFNAVKYLYRHGSKFCGLKNVFIDMYAIAALKPKDPFGEDVDLYPGEFVDYVDNYSKDEAYIERRKALKKCDRYSPDPESEEDDDMDDEMDDEMDEEDGEKTDEKEEEQDKKKGKEEEALGNPLRDHPQRYDLTYAQQEDESKGEHGHEHDGAEDDVMSDPGAIEQIKAPDWRGPFDIIVEEKIEL